MLSQAAVVALSLVSFQDPPHDLQPDKPHTLPNLAQLDTAEIDQELDQLATEIRKQIHDSGGMPKVDTVVDQLLARFCERFQDTDLLEATVRNYVEHTLSLNAARELAEGWTRRFPERGTWAATFISHQPVGQYEYSLGSVFHGAHPDQDDFLDSGPHVIKLRQFLDPEEAKLIDVNQAWCVWEFNLQKLDDSRNPVGDRRSLIVETFLRPSSDEIPVAAISWFGDSLKDLTTTPNRQSFILSVFIRINSMTTVAEGNRENPAVYREVVSYLSFDPSMTTRKVQQADGTWQRRLEVFSRESVGMTKPAQQLGDGFKTKILDQIPEWLKENKFLSIQGSKLDIDSQLIQEMLVPNRDDTKGISLQRIPSPALNLASGELAVIHLYAMWCGPCLAGMPKLDSLASELKSSRTRVISLCYNEAPRDSQGLEAFIMKHGPGHEFALARPKLWEIIRNPIVPSYLVIDNSGKVLFSIMHIDGKSDLTQVASFVREHQK